MKDIGANVWYTVLWGRASKVAIVRAGVQMRYYPAASLFLVIAMLSGTRVVRVPWVVMVVSLIVAWLSVFASGLRPSVLGYA